MNRTTSSPPSASGFSLVEIMIAVLVVSLAALLLVQISRANAAARAQSLVRAGAVRFGTELAEWTRRGGHHELGMPLAQALGATDAVGAANDMPASASDCHNPSPACDPQQAAWYYLSRWRARLEDAIGDARLVVCDDHPPESAPPGWPCDPDGLTRVLKIGKTWRSGGTRPSAVIDLGGAP